MDASPDQRRRQSRLMLVKIGLPAGVLIVLCICTIVVLQVFGNDGALGPFFCPTALPPLQMSGISPVSAPSPCVIDLRNHCPGVIDFLAPAAPAAPATPATGTGNDSGTRDEVLFSQDGTFYSVQPGPHSPNRLTLPEACAGVVALTADRTWLACVAHTEGCVDCFTACTWCFGTSVTVVSLLQASHAHQREVIASEPGVEFGVLSWSPDARSLALVRRQLGSTVGTSTSCSLAVYVGNGPDTSMTLAQESTFVGVNLCAVRQVLWSPDGDYIALLQGGFDDQSFAVYLVVSAKLAPTLDSRKTGPGDVPPIKATSLLTLPSYDAMPYHAVPYLAWAPGGHELAVSVAYGYQVVLVDPLSGAQSPVVTLPAKASPIGVFSWMPDGRRLIFAIGHGGLATCGAPPQSIYLYTPSRP